MSSDSLHEKRGFNSMRRLRAGLFPAAKRGQRARATSQGGSGCRYSLSTVSRTWGTTRSSAGCSGQDMPRTSKGACAKRKERAGHGDTGQ